MNERCGTCRFWTGTDITPEQEARGYDSQKHTGTCKRYPPVLNPVVVHGEATERASERSSYVDEAIEQTPEPWVWSQPTTQHDNWCGEWKPKPNDDDSPKSDAP